LLYFNYTSVFGGTRAPLLLLSFHWFEFGQDGWEILRNRRMNVHGALDDCVGRLRIHDVQQDVNDFIASGAKDRGSQNLFCVRINTDFDEALCLAFFIGPGHAAHGTDVH